MKGQQDEITFAGWVLITFIFITVFFLIMGKLSRADLQIALLNTERLTANINDVCALGGTKTIKDFSLLQPKAETFGGFVNFLPKFAIYGRGDPDYVLYYESFPIGEAIGWEVYQEFGDRVIAPLPHKTDMEIKDFVIYMSSHVANVNEKIRVDRPNFDGKIIVPNVILDQKTNVLVTEDPRPLISIGEDENRDGNLGKWKEEDSVESNVFYFSNIISLSQIEKSSIKYRPCGKNALCLKTGENVFRFPLECDNIKNIHLEYDARDPIGFYGPAIGIIAGGVAVRAIPTVSTAASTALTGVFKFGGKILTKVKSLFGGVTTGLITIGGIGYAAEEGLTFFFGSLLSVKNSDFYLASPCSIDEMTIEKVRCDSLPCKKWLKYPIYEIDGNVNSKGDHYQCIESIGEVKSDTVTIDPTGDCIKIKITNRPKDFCWTADPSRDFSLADLDTIALAKLLGFLPVQYSTEYFDKDQVKAIILKPTKESRSTLDNILRFIEDFVQIKKFSAWAWPG